LKPREAGLLWSKRLTEREARFSHLSLDHIAVCGAIAG